MKEEVLSWYKVIAKPYLIHYSKFLSINRDYFKNHWHSKKRIMMRIKYLKLIPVVFEYDSLLKEYWEEKNKFIFIDNKDWERQISSLLDRTKKYCIFCSNKNNEPYYQYLIFNGYKIIKVTQ